VEICSYVLAIALSVAGTAPGDQAAARLHLADARDYRHCHNVPGRVRCHESERLPANWPPNTDTPGSSERESPSRDAPAPTHHVHDLLCRHE
jgi:hypothetical protein